MCALVYLCECGTDTWTLCVRGTDTVDIACVMCVYVGLMLGQRVYGTDTVDNVYVITMDIA